MTDNDRSILLNEEHELATIDDNENEKDEDDRPGVPSEVSGWVYLCAVVAAIGGLLFGYDMGIISGAKTQIKMELNLSCSEIENVVMILPMGGLFASLVGGLIVDKYGRKWSIIFNAFLFTAGAVIIALTDQYLILMVGRFILGFAVSLSAIAECIYISEISTSKNRGSLVSLNELGITLGILLAFLVNYCFAEVKGGWRVMFALSGFVAVFQGIAMCFLPKTPQFLVISKEEAKAEAVLKKLKLTTNTRQFVVNIRHSLVEEENHSICVCNDRMPLRLTIGFGLVLFQQFSGQPNIIYYAADVFKQVGFCNELTSTLASVGLGVTKVLSTVISLSIVDKIGRRVALLSGISAMCLSVLVLSIFAFHQQESVQTQTCTENFSNFTDFERSFHCDEMKEMQPSSFRFVAFGALLVFVSAYSFSFGPVTWILLSEIFPPASKGRAMALATALNWLGNVIVSGTFLQATEVFTLGGVFFSYALICICAIVFISILVPETRDKTLEEISKELRTKKTSTIMKDNLTRLCGKKPRVPNMDLYSKLRVIVT